MHLSERWIKNSSSLSNENARPSQDRPWRNLKFMTSITTLIPMPVPTMKPDFPQALPEPHILDYDWRYTRETVMSLSALVRPSDDVLTVGAPSLARHLECCGYDVLLVDRQPFHAVRNHKQIEPGLNKPDFEKRTIAIVDPPWY